MLLIFFLEFMLLQAQYTEKLLWSCKRKLTWADFVYRDNSSNPFFMQAMTSPEISFQVIEDDTINVNVTVSLNLEESWTSDTISMWLLAHEQLHFDIAELYGRKIRKKMQALITEGEQSKSKYIDVFNGLFEAYEARQALYDEETKHSADSLKQCAWKRQICAELSELCDFRVEK